MQVLCVTDYFLPGFKGGGPIRTLDNMRRQLAGRVSLPIFTRDRDLGAEEPYEGIRTECWSHTSEGAIYYAGPKNFGPRGFRRALASGSFDLIYLNSFFSTRSSIRLNLLLRGVAPRLPVLLAPRGEFSPGALAIKFSKKRAYIATARSLGLYRHVFWHASTIREAEDILRQFPNAESRVHIAPDPILTLPPSIDTEPLAKQAGRLRLAFISRISPKKNLEGLLRVLGSVRRPVDLDVFGPVEDTVYWRRCMQIIETLPGHIRVVSHGSLAPDAVSPTFARFDLFAFPTQGENFGHVVFEALRVGTPVLLSDQTPWQDDGSGAVTTIPLDDDAAWRRAIEQAADRTGLEQSELRAETLSYAARYADEDTSLQANLKMFHSVLS